MIVNRNILLEYMPKDTVNKVLARTKKIGVKHWDAMCTSSNGHTVPLMHFCLEDWIEKQKMKIRVAGTNMSASKKLLKTMETVE